MPTVYELAFTDTKTNTQTNTRTNTRVHTRAQTHTHTHTHARTHARTHAHTLKGTRYQPRKNSSHVEFSNLLSTAIANGMPEVIKFKRTFKY